MKSLLLFWRVVLDQLGSWCHVSTTRDWETISSRFEAEGEEFLTIHLPDFAKDFERGLEQGRITPDLFPYFKKRQKLPLFLGGFMELVFERDTGELVEITEDNLSSIVNAVFAVRQLSLMFGKILKDCTPEREAAAFTAYLDCEKELEVWEDGMLNMHDRSSVGGEELSSLRHISHVLFRDTLTALDSDVYYDRLSPKHGPGRTADRLLGNEKFDQSEWPCRLESVFPYGEYAIPNWRYYYLLDRIQFLEPGAERPVRVVSVPKTQKTPRIIAIEPTCMQYMQQAISARLVDLLESDTLLSGMIGFSDQVPNQDLAREGSLSGNLATLDLSEASDRVSWLLVSNMLSGFWNLHDGVEATRSLTADVPGHGVIPLVKFASMGSALTFPIEAMVFTSIIFHGICRELNCPMSVDLVKRYQDRVRVYGDDIIIPVEFVASVIESLELFGFKVNSRKSFWTGLFRESCGAEFYDGENVSITRVRRDFPQSRADVQEIISTVSLRNQMYNSGLWKAAQWLDDLLMGVLPVYPTVHPTSPVVGRHTVLDYETQRTGEALHNPLVKGLVVNSRIPKSQISGEGALLKCLLNEGEPFIDTRHLERQGRPDAVRLKLRWAQPF